MAMYKLSSGEQAFKDTGAVTVLEDITDKLGIGTNSPTAKLHVVGSVKQESGTVSVASNGYMSLFAAAAVSLETTSGAHSITIGGENNAAPVNIGGQGARTIALGSAAATEVDLTATTIDINGDIDHDGGTCNINSAGYLSLYGAANVTLDTTSGSSSISIGIENNGAAINIGTTGTKTITLGSATAGVVAGGDMTVTGDLVLDDGGSIKEAGGTAAITVDAAGEVTKIGQDTPTDTQVLTWDNGNSKVVWSDAAAGGGGGGTWKVEADSSSTSGSPLAPAADTVVVACNTSGAARYVQLPAVASNTDRLIVIKDSSGTAGSNSIHIATNASETIDGSSSDLVVTTAYAAISLSCSGASWMIV